MGVTKSHFFSKEVNQLAEVAKVFAHPARLAIIYHISQQEGCICTDLVNEIGLAQPTISQHLKQIKKIGLLKGTFEGKNLCYCIDRERWEEIRNDFDQLFSRINHNCC